MSSQQQWQLDGSAPELYERYLVPAITSLWATDLIERVELEVGDRVLDAACGTGVVALLAAERVGDAGRVVGVDINGGMLEIARSHALGAGAPVEWHEASVLAIPFSDAAFDVVLCQLGLQFFPDRPAALRETHRVLVSGGRLALNVFGPLEHFPATSALVHALDRHLDPTASVAKRAEHVLGDPEALRILLADAGFHDVVINTTTKPVRFASPRDYVRIQLAATPLATVIGQLDIVRRDAVIEALMTDVSAALASYVEEGALVVPTEGHVALARTPTASG